MSIWTASLCLMVVVGAACILGPRWIALVPPMRVQPQGRSWLTRAPGWVERSSVVGALLVAGSGFSALMAFSIGHPILLLWSMAGPFAEPMSTMEYSWTRMIAHGGVTLLAAALHPIRPGLFTALASGLAVCWWFLVGLSFTYAGV